MPPAAVVIAIAWMGRAARGRDVVVVRGLGAEQEHGLVRLEPGPFVLRQKHHRVIGNPVMRGVGRTGALRCDVGGGIASGAIAPRIRITGNPDPKKEDQD